MQHKEDILNDDSLLERSFHAELYQRYAPGLFAYAYQQTASREDAEDIVLDVFLAVLQNKRFAAFGEKKREAWLWTITRNKVVDYYRRTTRRQQVSIEWPPLTIRAAISPLIRARAEYQRGRRGRSAHHSELGAPLIWPAPSLAGASDAWWLDQCGHITERDQPRNAAL